MVIAVAERQRELFEDLTPLEPPPDLASGYVLPSATAPPGEPARQLLRSPAPPAGLEA